MLRWKSTYNRNAKAASKTGDDVRFDVVDLDYIWPGLVLEPPDEDADG